MQWSVSYPYFTVHKNQWDVGFICVDRGSNFQKNLPMNKSIYLTFLLASVVVTLFAQKDPQADYDWKQYNFPAHFTLKNGGGKNIFATNKRIFIANFHVAQVIVASGKQTGSSNLAKMSVSMSPIKVEAYQALTDKLYQQMVERLKHEGYTIVSDAEVANSEFAKKEHNGKNVYCQYVNEVAYAKDGMGNELAHFRPTNSTLQTNE
jgi:hypothetical protein